MMRRAICVVLMLAASLGLAGRVQAHEVRPAYLQLTEEILAGLGVPADAAGPSRAASSSDGSPELGGSNEQST